MSFAYPFVLALPLLFLLGFFFKKKTTDTIFYPQIALLSGIKPSWRVRCRNPVLRTLLFISILALTVAAARPQRVNQISQETESRNIMLTLDLSGSMGTEDFPTDRDNSSRLAAVKSVVADFIETRIHDRLGLVVFGSNAFLQSPLTLDHDVIVDMVKRMQVGMAGNDTAIGDGLGLSLKRIQDIPGTSKAIILLTDGVNHAGQVNPLKAAKIAKDLGVKIHTIGIGSNGIVEQQVPGFFIPNVQQAEFDEETLKKIAEITGGVYFNATNLEGLKKVYAEIDKLEKSNADDSAKKIVEELFYIPALLTLVSYLLLLILGRSVFLKLPV